jgi:predicted dehydrogenase
VTKENRVLGVAIIGCGLIGQKRANSLGSGGKLIACADIDIDRHDEYGTSANVVY